MPPSDALLNPVQNAINSATSVAQQVATSVERGFGSALGNAEALGRRITSTIAIAAQTARDVGVQVMGRVADGIGEIATAVRQRILDIGGVVIRTLLQARAFIVTGLVQVVSTAASIFGGTAALVRTLAAPFIAVVRTLVVGLFGAVTGTIRGAATGGGGVGAMLAGFAGAVAASIAGLFGVIILTVRTASSLAVSVTVGVVHALIGAIIGVFRLVGAILTAGFSFGPIGIVIVVAIVGLIANVLLAFVAKVATLVTQGLSFVGRLITQAFTLLGPIVSNVFAFIGAGVRAVWGGLTSAFNTAMGIVRSALATVAGWAQSAWQFASSTLSRAMSLIATNAGPFVSAIMNAVSQMWTFALALGQVLVVGAVVGVFSKAIYEAARAAMEFAQSAKLLGAQTGWGLSQSAGVLRNFQANGIGANAVSGAIGNTSPFVFGLRARVFGLPDFNSPQFGAQLATRFQSMNASGPIGNIMARAMMRTLGIDNADFLRLANTSPATQRANVAFSQNVNASLGLTPQQLAAYSEQIPALVTRIGVLFDAIKMRLAGEALPIVQQVLSGVANFVASNATQIAQFIRVAVEWLFVRAPILIADGLVVITQMTANALQTLLAWATFVVTQLPTILAVGAQTIADTLRSWSAALADWAPRFINGFADFLVGLGATLADWINRIATAIADQISALSNWLQSVWADQNNPFRVMVMQIARGLDTMVAMARDFVGRMAQFSAGLTNMLNANPIIGQVLAYAFGLKIGMQSPTTAYNNATAGIGTSNFEDMARRFFAGPTLPRAAASLADVAASLRTNAAGVATDVSGGMNTLANNARVIGTNVANMLIGGLNGAANFFSGPNGNLGQRLGDTLANAVRPALNPLSMAAQGVQNFANAAQSYRQSLGTEDERRSRWQELIDATNNVSSTIREEARNARAPMTGGVDAIAAYMLSSLAFSQGRAVRNFGGGGTA